jgi:hypothetical protein
MALSTAEQRELLRLLREFAPLARRLEGQLNGDGSRGFDGAPTALAAAPAGDDYWNHGYPDGHAAARGRIEPQIDAQQLLNLRGGRVSGPPIPSARDVPRTRTIDGGREAARDRSDRSWTARRLPPQDRQRHRSRPHGPVRHGSDRPRRAGTHAVGPDPGRLRGHLPRCVGGQPRLACTRRATTPSRNCTVRRSCRDPGLAAGSISS